MEPTPGTDARGSSPASPSGRATTDSTFCCSYCQKSFRRPEHLKRHEKSHTSPRAYVCSTCGKSFARRSVLRPLSYGVVNLPLTSAHSDVLLRHEYVHRSMDRADDLLRRQKRACLPCAKARERCSRSEPCSRCEVKSIKCQYRRRERTKHRCEPGIEDRVTHTGDSDDGSLLTPSPYRAAIAQPTEDEVFSSTMPRSQAATPAGNAIEENGTGSQEMEDVHPQTGAKASYHAYQGSRVASPNTWRAEHQSQLLGLVTPSIAAYPPNAGLGNGPDVNWLPASEDWNMQWTSILEVGLRSDMALAPSGGPSPSMLPPTPRDSGGNEGVDAPTVYSAASGPPGTPSTRGSYRSIDRGRLYATSSSARATAYERDSQQEPLITGAHAQVPISKLLQNEAPTHGSSIHGLTPQYPSDPDFSKSVWQSTYDHILNEFRIFNTTSEGNSSRLVDEGFLSIKQLYMVVQLFFNRFLPSLPIFHETLSGPNEYWILTLAMATIGCHYTKTEEFDRMVVPLHEFLFSALQRRAFSQREPVMELLYLQAFLLSQIGLTYYGPTEMRDRALLHHGSLIRRAENLGLFSSSAGHFYGIDPVSGSQATPVQDSSTRWQTWVKEETARRLGYSIWVCCSKT